MKMWLCTMKNGVWQMIFLRKVHKMKIILIIFAVIVLFVIVSFVRHNVCSAKERNLLTPLGELVEVNGHNMSVYTEGDGDKTFVFMSGSGHARLYWILSHCIRC